MTDINAQRLAWLHSAASYNVDGYEWGIYRVKWENGKAVEVWQTNGDFSDLDAAIGAHPAPASASALCSHPCGDIACAVHYKRASASEPESNAVCAKCGVYPSEPCPMPDPDECIQREDDRASASVAGAGEALPDEFWEALQRLLENAVVQGPASMDDARLVGRYRDQLAALAVRPVAEPMDFEGIAAELWAMAQKGPGQGFEENIALIENRLREEFEGRPVAQGDGEASHG